MAHPVMSGYRGLFRGCLILSVILLGGLGLLCCDLPGQQPEMTTKWKTGTDFQVALEDWVSLALLSGTGQDPFRQVCQLLADRQQVSVVIDRRFDPGKRVTLELPVSGSTKEVLEQIANTQQAVLREVGSAIYVLPEAGASRFRTLIALRTQELSDLATQKSANTKTRNLAKNVLSPRTYRWESFQTPRELAINSVQQCGLSLANAELIPHDLWYQGALPRGHLIELLSFILYQYDLTFRWNQENSLEIVSIPEHLEITRTHTLSPRVLEELQPRLQKEFPESVWKKNASRWEVTGPEDLHELLARNRTGMETPRNMKRVRWDERRFTMKVQQKSLQDVLIYLQTAGLPVKFDAEQLKMQGHDPTRLIHFDVTDQDIDGLFRAICSPPGVPFQITEDHVHVGAADKP